MPLSLAVIIDYQNVHLTARDTFAPEQTAWETLIDPARFADQLVAARNAAMHESDEADVGRAIVYRGRPSNHRDPGLYAATQRQVANWTRDRRVEVHQRTLRYPPPHVTNEKPQEKGIDVMVALRYTRIARTGEYDVVVLATHDTDLEPALDEAMSGHRARIETAGWLGARQIRPSKGRLWHTRLTATNYLAARDRREYRDG